MKKVISVQDVELGMEIASPVQNKFGQILLTPNLIVEEKHKHLLRTWGIKTIEIKTTESYLGVINIDEKLKVMVKDNFLKLAGWNPRNPYEEDMFEMAVQMKCERQTSEL